MGSGGMYRRHHRDDVLLLAPIRHEPQLGGAAMIHGKDALIALGIGLCSWAVMEIIFRWVR
jgi:hypothetical protein